MIATITVGRGNSRTYINLPRDRRARRVLSHRIKSALFPTNVVYMREKARGIIAVTAALTLTAKPVCP